MDQIALLAGLQGDEKRASIWAHPRLRARLERLAAAGLVVARPAEAGGGGRFVGLSQPEGVRAANAIRFKGLDDLMAEHLVS